jgi:hypothetical protein
MATSRLRNSRRSIAALMGLVAIIAVVARWPFMVFPATVLLAIHADRLRLSLLHAGLLMLLLGAALGVAMAPGILQQRRETASPTGPQDSPNGAFQRTGYAGR